MPKRSNLGLTGYRFGFNGKESDNDVKGLGNQQDYGMRIYDPRIGKFLSVDPITKNYPELTPYQFASNRPIDGTDEDGLEYNSTSTYVHKVTPQIRITTYEIEILKADIYGTGVIGRKSVVEASIKATRDKYYFSIGENIRNGPFGAIGYLVGGDKGSYVGASADGIAMSFGGVPGKSSVLSKPSNKIGLAPTSGSVITSYEHPPVNLLVNLKPTWTKEQVSDAVNKANLISNSTETQVNLKQPEARPSNLRSIYKKAGGVVSNTQHVDHKVDLQFNGTSQIHNLHGLDGSVNTSLGKQFNLQIRNLPDNTRVNKVYINALTFKQR